MQARAISSSICNLEYQTCMPKCSQELSEYYHTKITENKLKPMGSQMNKWQIKFKSHEIMKEYSRIHVMKKEE